MCRSAFEISNVEIPNGVGVQSTRDFLVEQRLPSGDLNTLPSSSKRFPDGGQYRMEIPSVEHPDTMDAVLNEAELRGVPIHRISQGSGGMLSTDAELAGFARQCKAAGVEVSLFARPTAAWDIGGGDGAPSSGGLASQARGVEQLVFGLEDISRIASYGIRSVLVTDVGVLSMASEMRQAGLLPADLTIKVSVQMGFANPASIRVAESLGADSYNVPTDLSLAQLAAIRAAIDIPLDVYIESPDDLGGFLRYYEIAEVVRVAAPVYLKFGLRNSPFLYPSGTHLGEVAIKLARERVRRAQIGLGFLERYYPDAVMSPVGTTDLALPVEPGHVRASAPASRPVVKG